MFLKYDIFRKIIEETQFGRQTGQLYNVDETGINDHMSSREKAYAARGQQLYQKRHVHFSIKKC